MSDKGVTNSITDSGNAHIELVATPDELRLLRQLRTLEPADYEAQYFDNKPAPRGDRYRQMGNPSSLGISVFAVANTTIALYLMQIRRITHSNALTGILWFTGGAPSFLTAIFELLLGNTFAWCVFGSFGGYYMAFGSVLTPSFNIAGSYTNPTELDNALGVFFFCWVSLFFIFLLASLKTNLVFVWIFTLVDITAWLLAASYYQATAGNSAAAVKCQKAGGASLFARALGGWYLLVIQLTESLDFGFKIPIGSLALVEKEVKRNA